MTIKLKIMLLAGLTTLSLIILSAMAVSKSNQFMMFLLKDKIQALTESTIGIASALEQDVRTGRLSQSEAKEHFKHIVHNMHYDEGKEFFFAVDYAGNFIAMGGAPEMVGSNIIDLKDPKTNEPMTQQLIQLAKSGGGFHYHHWPKAGETVPEPKVAYVAGFEPWNMYVGTGLYYTRIDQLFYEFLTEIAVVVTLLIGIISALLLIIFKSIFSRLSLFRQAMNEVASGDADLSARLDEKAKDEFAEIANAFNRFIAEIQKIVSNARGSAEAACSTSAETASSAQNTNLTIQQQQQQIEMASTAINQMSATIQEIAQRANNTSEKTKETAATAKQGQNTASATVNAIVSLEGELIQTAEKVTELKSSSDDIGSILEVIKAIAEQTNLLALNAAIEAARAGESGRGFAVVADEVRNLAQRTQESTAEIEAIIGSLQSASTNAFVSMQQSREKITETIQLAQHSGEMLQEIQQNTIEISDMNTQVATATEEQSTAAKEINNNVLTIQNKSLLVIDNAQFVLTNSEKLSSLSLELKDALAKFQV